MTSLADEDVFRIAGGAGFAGDRYEPADLLAEYGGLDALVFECLAERTIALAQQRLASGDVGFDRRIRRRLSGVLPHLVPRGATVITNAGAADPRGAAQETLETLDDLGLRGRARVAAVSGDDVLHSLNFSESEIIGTDMTLADIADRVVSANAYLGADVVRQGLESGANIVLTGRVSDAALFLAPIADHFGWNPLDLEAIAGGTLVGHLLECAGQLTGGYFADGFHKKVPDLAHLGFPFADVNSTGAALYGKLPGTGGLLSRETVLEQLLYEIDDPSAYLTPDAAVDLRSVTVEERGDGRVFVGGATASWVPEKLKVSVGVRDGLIAVSTITYGGYRASERAEIAAEIIRERWESVHGQKRDDLVIDYLGRNATRPWAQIDVEPPEVQVRFTLRTIDSRLAHTLADEVEALYTNGPAGGGGVTGVVKETIGIVSTLVSRDSVEPMIEVFE